MTPDEKKDLSGFWKVMAYITWTCVLLMSLSCASEWLTCGKFRCPSVIKVYETP